MSTFFKSPIAGIASEFESELRLPVRIEYAVDADGEVEIVAIHAIGLLPQAPVKIPWRALPREELQDLEAEAAGHAADLAQDRQLARHGGG